MVKTATKSGKKRPQGRSPAYTVFARVPPELGTAWEAYLASVELKPSITVAIAAAMGEFLAARGFWDFSKRGGSDG